MKFNNPLSGLLLILVSAAILNSCVSQQKTEPTVTTTSINEKSAWLVPCPKKYQLDKDVILDTSFAINLNNVDASGISLLWLRNELTCNLGWSEKDRENAVTLINFSIEKIHHNDEAYSLEISENSIRITASSSQGINRGIARLLYIMKTPIVKYVSDNKIACPSIKIFDWPDFQLRGMHLQMAFSVNEELVKKVVDVLAVLGYNMVVFEIGGNFESNSHPECVAKAPWTRKQLKELVQFAKSRGITPIPAINTIGHIERAPKIFTIKKTCENGKIKAIGMDITHKDFYKVYFEIIDELAGIFDNPPYFHIGTDEFFDVAPVLDKKSTDGLGSLYANLLDKVNKHLEEKKIKTVIWHDMLFSKKQLNAGEPANGELTSETLNKINKNIIIDYWAYSRLDEYKGLSLIKNKGFKMWATPWFAEAGIKELCIQAWKLKADCILGSTWADDYPWGDSFVTTSEYSWNASKACTESIKYNPWVIANLLLYNRPGSFTKKETVDFSFTSSNNPPLPEFIKQTFLNKEISSSGISLKIKNPCYLGTTPEPVLISNPSEIREKAGEFKLMILNPRNCTEGVYVDALNRKRGDKELIIYTAATGKSTGTNIYGQEWVVRNNKVVNILKDKGNTEITQDSYVISVHRCGFYKDRFLDTNLLFGDNVQLLKLSQDEKTVTAHAKLPENKANMNNFAIFFTRLYPASQMEKLAECTVLMSDNSTEKFELQGDIFNWKYPTSHKRWSLWIAGQDINNPQKKIIALEWQKDKTKPYPVSISVEVFPAGKRCGFTILGASSW